MKTKTHYILAEMKIEVPESEEFVTDSFFEVEKEILGDFVVKEMFFYETELEGSKELENSVKKSFDKILKSKKYDSCIKFPLRCVETEIKQKHS